MARILVVDDEKVMVKGIRFNLENEGYTVDVGYNGRQAVELARANEYDLIILDLMMPELDGLQACMEIRAFSTVPIIMLTAKGTEYDQVVGLDNGADDYIPKPFGMMALVARIKAVLRRTEKPVEEKVLRLGELSVNPTRHVVQVSGDTVNLTLKEFELLCLLLDNPGVVFTRDQLLNQIWGYSFDGESRTVDVHVRHLRQKLGDCGNYIETVRGIGYRSGDGKA